MSNILDEITQEQRDKWDSIYESVVKPLISAQSGHIGISWLQRHIKIGYFQAFYFHNKLLEDGVLMRLEDNSTATPVHDEVKRLFESVDKFADLMKERLYEKFKKGYRGWDDVSKREAWMNDLVNQVHEDLQNHKEVDIANRAMMIYFLTNKGD